LEETVGTVAEVVMETSDDVGAAGVDSTAEDSTPVAVGSGAEVLSWGVSTAELVGSEGGGLVVAGSSSPPSIG
jgi:hypothetical protein